MIEYAASLPFTCPGGMVVVGHSGGGWGAIAHDAVPHPRVTAFVNMAAAAAFTFTAGQRGLPSGIAGRGGGSLCTNLDDPDAADLHGQRQLFRTVDRGRDARLVHAEWRSAVRSWHQTGGAQGRCDQRGIHRMSAWPPVCRPNSNTNAVRYMANRARTWPFLPRRTSTKYQGLRQPHDRSKSRSLCLEDP